MKNTVVIGGDASLVTQENGQGEKVLVINRRSANLIVDHLEHGYQTDYTSALSFNDVYNSLENGILVVFLDTFAGDIHYYIPYEVSSEPGEECVYLTDVSQNRLRNVIITDLDAPLVFTDF